MGTFFARSKEKLRAVRGLEYAFMCTLRVVSEILQAPEHFYK